MMMNWFLLEAVVVSSRVKKPSRNNPQTQATNSFLINKARKTSLLKQIVPETDFATSSAWTWYIEMWKAPAQNYMLSASSHPLNNGSHSIFRGLIDWCIFNQQYYRTITSSQVSCGNSTAISPYYFSPYKHKCINIVMQYNHSLHYAEKSNF